jgi:hypothetical protein
MEQPSAIISQKLVKASPLTKRQLEHKQQGQRGNLRFLKPPSARKIGRSVQPQAARRDLPAGFVGRLAIADGGKWDEEKLAKEESMAEETHTNG